MESFQANSACPTGELRITSEEGDAVKGQGHDLVLRLIWSLLKAARHWSTASRGSFGMGTPGLQQCQQSSSARVFTDSHTAHSAERGGAKQCF